MALTLAISLAAVSGCCGTLSAIAISYPAHIASVHNGEQSRCSRLGSTIANLLLTCVATILQILACGQGPVAIVFPMSVATGLASNMILQWYLKLAAYGKAVRVGTYMLVIAVILNSKMGPKELSPDEDVRSLVFSKSARYFSFVCLSVMICSICAITFKWTKSNAALLLLYILVGGTGTVLNTSISKMLQMDLGFAVNLPLGILYVFLAVTCVGSAVRANSELQDPSLFIPISNGTNLILNCVAGICIWGDMNRLRTDALSYFLIYFIVFLGTYLVSAFDLFQMYAMTEIYAQVGQVSKQTLARSKTGITRLTISELNVENFDEGLLKSLIEKSVINQDDIINILLREEVRPYLDELAKKKMAKEKNFSKKFTARSLSFVSHMQKNKTAPLLGEKK